MPMGFGLKMHISSVGIASIALAQSASNQHWNNGGTWSPGPAYPNNVSAGNLLVCCLLQNPNSSQAALTDTLGNTWNHVITSNPCTGDSNTTTQIWYVRTTTGGSCTISNIDGTVGNVEVVLFELNGFSAGVVLDGTPTTALANTNAACSCGPITTTGSSTFLVSPWSTLGGGDTSETGWASISPTIEGNQIEWLITTGPGSYTATWTPNDTYSSSLAGFTV